MKVCVFVDVQNLYHNGGRRLRYDVLRELACRGGAEPVRLNAYAGLDAERAERDASYRAGTRAFHHALREFGYKVIIKEVSWYTDDRGRKTGKANADVDLAVDALEQTAGCDRVLVASGDGDFCRLVEALQRRGLRVEVLALEGASSRLQQEADAFVCGFLVPGLVPFEDERDPGAWGEVGSRVRGTCTWFDPEKGFGYIRYLKTISPSLWITDDRNPDSPWQTVFFHKSALEDPAVEPRLAGGGLVLSFTLEQEEERTRAGRIELVCKV